MSADRNSCFRRSVGCATRAANASTRQTYLEDIGVQIKLSPLHACMNREYHKWYSHRLGRDMELLIFGHAGTPTLVFPTSQGRFYEYEDRGMVWAMTGKIDAGALQLFCV